MATVETGALAGTGPGSLTDQPETETASGDPVVLIMANGDTAARDGIQIHAVPMCNLTPSHLKNHSKRRGNGYVLTLGGKRIYISGDTESTPEMRALEHIDAAFVCMNLPWTMDVAYAADAVPALKPAMVYPYHHKGQNTANFKRLVNAK